MLRRRYILFMFLFFLLHIAWAQTDSIKRFTIQLSNIQQNEGSRVVEYVFKDDLYKFYVIGDSIKVNPDIYKYSAGINDLKRISLLSGNNLVSGTIVGCVLGFVGGFFAGLAVTNPNSADNVIFSGLAGGLMLTLPVGAVFGLLGSMTATYKEYDLGNYPLVDKKALLIKILRDNRYK